MATVNINGVPIYYEVHGDGEPLLLIHHGIGCTEMWKELLPGFTRNYKVVLYDRRGFGKSEKGEDLSWMPQRPLMRLNLKMSKR